MKNPSRLKRIENFCGSMQVNVWLLLLAALNLLIGSIYATLNPKLFAPFNNLTIQAWLERHAGGYPGEIWWIFSLIVLLGLLGINTAVCVLREWADLWAKRKAIGPRLLSVRMCPALIHLCFIIILLGHGSSLVTGFRQTAEIAPGSRIELPDGAQVELLSRTVARYEDPKALRGLMKKSEAVLVFRKDGREQIKRIGIVQPVFWNGMSFHLFMSKRQTGPGQGAGTQLIIKEDPGIAVILWTFAIMIAVMLWYYFHEMKILRRVP